MVFTTILSLLLLFFCFFHFHYLAEKWEEKFTETKRVHRILIIFQEEFERELYDTIAQNGAIVKKTFFHNKYHEEERVLKKFISILV